MFFAIQVSPYLWLLLLAFLISSSLAVYALLNFRVRGAMLFGLLAFSICLWVACYTMEVMSLDPAAKEFWLKAKQFGVAHVSIVWLAFTLQYSGYGSWLRPAILVPLELISLLNIAGAWTNDLHHLFWVDIWVGEGIQQVTRGSWSWFAVSYNYLLFLAGCWVLFTMWWQAEYLYKRQVTLILSGAAVPLLANFLTISRLSPLPALDLTPFAFTVTGLVVAWSLFRFQFLDVMPVAYEAIVRNMSDGVIVLDVHGRVVSFNPAIQAIMGLDTVHVIGHQVDEVLPDWPELLKYLKAEYSVSIELVHGSGEYFELYVTPLTDRRGGLSGKLAVLHDVTDRVRAVEERERLIAELDAFAHTVAHDLKNPLGVTMGYADLVASMVDEIPPDTLAKNLRMIVNNSHKMNSIINELLLLSSVRKLDDVRRSPVDMNMVVTGAQERLLGMIEDRSPEIIVPGEWPPALGYQPWVEEVVTNYLSNAIKYGGDPPRVEFGATVQEDGYVCYWVRDNGPGIDPTQQSVLFEQFTRLDETRAEGNGLGLSIVKRIVEKLGGEVGMESDVGKGSTFQFTLPGLEQGGVERTIQIMD